MLLDAAPALVLPVALVLAQAPAPRAADPLPAAATAAPGIDAVGVVRSSTPGRSVAILASGGKTRIVGIGESAFGATLVAIGDGTVTLEIGGERVSKRLTSGAAPVSPVGAPIRPAPAAAAAGPPEDPETPRREMDRAAVQTRLGSEMNRILAETAMVPVMEDGHVAGVQLTRIAEGSLLTDAGLRAGDVVKRINDTDIDGMATLIGLWPRLQGASELRATVVRNGQPVSLVVTLR
jgi:type II secretion system protein C